MIELYFNDANLLPENREEEQYAEAALNNILAGKTAEGLSQILCKVQTAIKQEQF